MGDERSRRDRPQEHEYVEHALLGDDPEARIRLKDPVVDEPDENGCSRCKDWSNDFSVRQASS